MRPISPSCLWILIGAYKNGGRELARTGEPVEVNTHDFPDKELGKAIPYGIYDVGANEGWISVGISADTCQFAVNSIRGWWQHLGKDRYPAAQTLTITADSGEFNSPRVRLWKTELQKLADEIGLAIRVLHFLPGTSKWNKIEHRPSSYISINWRAKPLTSYQVVIADRRHHHRHRPEGLRPSGHQHLADQAQSPRHRDQRRQPHRRSVSPRMELHR